MSRNSLLEAGAKSKSALKLKVREDVYRMDDSIKNWNEESLTNALLYGSDRFNGSKNKQILLQTICYIHATSRFERPLIDQC